MIDLHEVARNLDADELALLIHTRISNRPQTTAAAALGWTPLRAERTRKRLVRKLGKLAEQLPTPARRLVETPDYSFPQHRERLTDGRRVWSMRQLPRGFADMVLDGLKVQVVDNAQSVRSLNYRVGAQSKVKDLEKQLRDAESNVVRIGGEMEDATMERELVTRELIALESTTAGPAVLDILEGRPPRTSAKEIEAVRLRLDQGDQTVALYQRALSEARQRVESARNEIAAVQDQIDAQAMEPEITKWYKAAEGMVEAHAAVSRKLSELNRPIDLTSTFFPSRNPAAMDWRAREMREVMMALFNAGSTLRRLKESGAAYIRKAEAA